MPKSVTYRTKIVGVSKVLLQGPLTYSDGWKVGGDSLEEWLDKIKDEEPWGISLTIEVHNGPDESHLLPTDDQP